MRETLSPNVIPLSRAARDVKEAREAVKPPEILKGDLVLWYPDGDKTQDPYPALVTRLGYDTLNLNIFDPNSYNMRIRDGVRWIDDPRAKSPELREAGGWDLSPQAVLIRDLQERLEKLERKVLGS